MVHIIVKVLDSSSRVKNSVTNSRPFYTLFCFYETFNDNFYYYNMNNIERETFPLQSLIRIFTTEKDFL